MKKPISKIFSRAAIVAGISLMATSSVQAQFSNGENNGATLSGVASQSASAPKNNVSLLPLTTLEATPLTLSGTLDPSDASGSASDPQIGSQSYGSSATKWPYSHRRVATYGNPGPGAFSFQVPVTSRPYRFTGKLYAHFPGDPANQFGVCTASLIKRAVLITAAHCIHKFGMGQAGYADQVFWYPANYASYGGYWGFYTATNIYAPTPYWNGSDTCQSASPGVVCNNDIATVTLAPKNGLDAGAAMGGWYNYGWNGYSYPTSSPAFGNHTIASITQLGYPVAWDGGFQMQQNSSFGKYIEVSGASTTTGQPLKNTQLGSPLTGGSSGGPWMVNFGTYPVLTNSSVAAYGFQSQRNTVVGTTSWGFTTKGVNVQGASWFGQNNEYPNAAYGAYGAGNIGAIVQTTCGITPAAC